MEYEWGVWGCGILKHCDLLGNLDFMWKFRVGDYYQADIDNQYEITIDFRDYLVAQEADPAVEGDQGSCWLPVWSHPDPNPEGASVTYDVLENEHYTWFVGSMFFEHYFTVFDERPVVEGLEEHNYVGFAACAANANDILLADDHNEVDDGDALYY